MQAKYTYLAALGLLFFTSCVYVVEEPYDPRTPYLGTYEVEEWSEIYGGTTYYDVSIYRSGYGDREIWISNFYGINLEVRAEVSSSGINIPRQFIGDYEVWGWGDFDGQGRLRFSFEIVEHRVFSDTYDACDALLYRY